MTVTTLFQSTGCETAWFRGQEISTLQNVNGKIDDNNLAFCPSMSKNFTAVNYKPHHGRQAIFNDDSHSL